MEVDLSAQELGELPLEPDEAQTRRTARLELHEHVHVALGSERLGQDGAEEREPRDPVPPAQAFEDIAGDGETSVHRGGAAGRLPQENGSGREGCPKASTSGPSPSSPRVPTNEPTTLQRIGYPASVQDDSSIDPRERLRRDFPSYGPDWDAAIEYGVDVSILEENLRMTPTERLDALQAILDFTHEFQGALHRPHDEAGPA